jgi:hypothetical protein
MGFWDILFEPLPLDGMLKIDRQHLISNLERASVYLENMEYVVDERHKVAEYRSKIDKTVEVLKFPDTAYRNTKSALKIAMAVRELSKIRYIPNDPNRAALAFGRLFAGIGELAHYLPPPVNGYFEIFAEAEMFFVNLRAKMQPEVHMREPGLRETIDNL